MRQNWWTAGEAGDDDVVLDVTWPARVALLEKMQWLPTMQSWATWV